MNNEDFVFYRDEKNNVFSGGYKINNIFKKLDLPIMQQKGGSSLVIPMGLFYTKSDIPEDKYIENNQIGGEIDDGLFNRLLELSTKNTINTKPEKKTRKKRETNTYRRTRKKR